MAVASKPWNVFGSVCSSVKQSPAVSVGFAPSPSLRNISAPQGRFLHCQRKTIQLCEIFEDFDFFLFSIKMPGTREALNNKSKQKNSPIFMWGILVSEHLFSALCFDSDVSSSSSLAWSDQQVSEIRNLTREKSCLKLLCLPCKKCPRLWRNGTFQQK